MGAEAVLCAAEGANALVSSCSSHLTCTQVGAAIWTGVFSVAGYLFGAGTDNMIFMRCATAASEADALQQSVVTLDLTVHPNALAAGGLPFVQKNFTLVVLAIVVVSVVPVILEVCTAR